MTRNAAAVLTFAMIFLLTGCSSIEVARDYDPGADFRALSDWNWLPAKQTASADSTGLNERRIRDSIRDVLVQKGFAFTEQNPDFYVTYHDGIDYDLELNTFYDRYGYGYGTWWTGLGPLWGSTTYVSRTEEAVITVDVIRAGERRDLIWRGVARYPWDAGDEPLDREKQVREAVAKVLETFPPTMK